ncbi:hypothetical protein ACLKA7_000652 [Drosophila subpalustris]
MSNKTNPLPESGASPLSSIMPAPHVSESTNDSQLADNVPDNNPNKTMLPVTVQEKLAYYRRMIEMLDNSGTCPDSPQTVVAMDVASSPSLTDSVGNLIIDEAPLPTTAVEAELQSASAMAIDTADNTIHNAPEATNLTTTTTTAAQSTGAPSKAFKPPQIVVQMRQQQQQQQEQQLQQHLQTNPAHHVLNDIDYLINKLNNHSPPITDFSIKLGGPGTVRILPKTSDVYRAIIHVLKLDNTLKYNTYQLREDRSFRVVVHGIHSSTDPQRIRNELTQLGYAVNVANTVSASSESTLNPRSRLEQINKLQLEHKQRQLLQFGTSLDREDIVRLQQQQLDSLCPNVAPLQQRQQRQQQQQQQQQQQPRSENIEQMQVDDVVERQHEQQQQQQQQSITAAAAAAADEQGRHVALLTELLIKQQTRSDEMMGHIAKMQQQIAGFIRHSGDTTDSATPSQ